MRVLSYTPFCPYDGRWVSLRYLSAGLRYIYGPAHAVKGLSNGVVYDLFREFSQPTLKHRSLFCCLSSREQIPERLTALLTLKHPDFPLLAPHLLMKALQEVRRPDEPPERLGKRDRQVG